MTPTQLADAARIVGAPSPMEEHFDRLAQALDGLMQPGERYTASFAGEDTDFVRMNRGKVRQPGRVAQRYATLRLIRGQRHAHHTVSLAGDATRDAKLLGDALAGLRLAMPDLTDDPHLLLPDTVASSRSVRGAALPAAAQMVDEILAAGAGLDLVGLLASGTVCRGFANSEGQRNWHEVSTFNLQWSLYHRADKAVKSSYTGFSWDADELSRRMALARERLGLIALPARSLAPGNYRAYLAPAAMEEIAGLLAWGAFSARALATRQSVLARMQQGARLDPRVTVTEDVEAGVAPGFQADGFARPPRVPLIERGALTGSLVSPRTAREFDQVTNGANAQEAPEALAMNAGDLAIDDALTALDTGLAIGNLWYLNYSDRNECRMTGMTRFATFWVEKGRIVAPIDVLRFDDTLYNLLGGNLEAITAQRELLLDPSSYGSRQLTSTTLPGVLVKQMRFTL
ncbi:MAG TPA: metallopeptidase TldD-related protein [Casimicrobiaceae bacterium]|nr:metallopeptidase TldD-related protein [Casimicrobiaceae bacterium]